MSKHHICLIKQFIFMLRSHHYCIMFWVISLNNYITSFLYSTSSTCNLCNKLKSSFVGLIVTIIQANIGIHNSNKCNVRIIMTFCNHLSSHKNAWCGFRKLFQNFLMPVFPSSCVVIHSKNWNVWEHLF